jgi:hypothetical protein
MCTTKATAVVYNALTCVLKRYDMRAFVMWLLTRPLMLWESKE